MTLGRSKLLRPRRIAQPPRELMAARRIGPGLAELRYRGARAGAPG